MERTQLIERPRRAALRLAADFAAVLLLTFAAALLVGELFEGERDWTREDERLNESRDREMRERFQAVAEDVWRANGL